jgi:hypothetical protein
MYAPGVDDEVLMDEQVRREFGHVKEATERIEEHLQEQDRHLSDHFKKFTQHTLEDQVMKISIEAHLLAHKEESKHRWMIYSGIFITAISTLGILAVEMIKHFYLKG